MQARAEYPTGISLSLLEQPANVGFATAVEHGEAQYGLRIA
jgi:hypothetical protein